MRTRSHIFRGALPLLVAAATSTATLLSGSGVAFAEAPASRNHVRAVSLDTVQDAKTHATLRIEGSEAPNYALRIDGEGRTLLLDLHGTDVSEALAPLAEGGLVAGVRTQAFGEAAGGFTRVTIHTRAPVRYRLRPEGTKLFVELTAAEKTVAESRLPMVPTLAAAAGGADTVAPTTVAVSDVRFERRGSKDRVIVAIEGGDVPAYGFGVTAQGHVRLELKGTALPAPLAQRLDTSASKGAVRSVTSSADAPHGFTYIELEKLSGATGVVRVEGNSLVWSFDAPSVQVQEQAKGNATVRGGTSITVAREKTLDDFPAPTQSVADVRAQGVVMETSGDQQAGFATAVAGQVAGAGRYSGRRIDLDLKDADIHNILRLLADVGKVNIVTADDVAGSVTIRMKNVPWDQALDVVLQAKGLGMVRQGNLIRVAPLAALQKERELRLAAAKQEYELTPLETRLIPVSYATADELQARAKDLLSPRGSIAVDERTNVLIARDIATNLNFIEELVRSLDTQTPQVLIEARIVEATSKYLRDIGIQWGGDTTFSSATGNPTGISFPSNVGITGGNFDSSTPTKGVINGSPTLANPNFAVNLPAAVGTGAGGAIGFNLGSIDNTINVYVRLSAAESSGMLRIVSSPRILTLDNREARISQGTLIPFSQISAQGVQTTFQEAKLQLIVKPHVTADASVAMHVKINRDEPDFNQTSARGDPTILKREAETDLLVQDGHTAVIGGIYTRNTGRNLDQIPFFGDIPILGILFQRRRASDTRNELVIFLTPRIVNRSEALGR